MSNRLRIREWAALSSVVLLGGTACGGAGKPAEVKTFINPGNSHELVRDGVRVMEVFNPDDQTPYSEQDSLCDGTDWVRGTISIDKTKKGYEANVKASEDANNPWCLKHPAGENSDVFTYYINGMRIDRILRSGSLLSRVTVTMCEDDTLIEATGEIDSAEGFSDKPTTIGIARSKADAPQCADDEISPDDYQELAPDRPQTTV